MAGFGAGTGSVFSLLPAQNATGNWIKIIQRVPVRIALDARELAANPLQIGLSMRAEVDTHDRAARVCRASSAATPVMRRRCLTPMMLLAEERVHSIILANGSTAAPASPRARAAHTNASATAANAAHLRGMRSPSK